MESEFTPEKFIEFLKGTEQPKSKLRSFHRGVVLIRDLTVACGVPAMVGAYFYLHTMQADAEKAKYEASQEEVKLAQGQIDSVKAQNGILAQEIEKLQQLQPKNVADIIDGTKKVAEEQREQLQRQVDNDQTKQQALQKELETLKSDSSSKSNGEIQKYQLELSALEDQIRDLEVEVSKKSIELERSKKEIETLAKSQTAIKEAAPKPNPPPSYPPPNPPGAQNRNNR